MELINLKQCNTCNLFEPDVKFCEKRKMCNICRRRSKNIDPNYNHKYYLLNKEAIAKQQKEYRIKKKIY